MSLRVTRTYDMNATHKIMCDSEMYGRIAAEGVDFKSLAIPNNPDVHWVLFETDRDVVGMGFYFPVNSATVRYHIHVLKKFRADWALRAGELTVWYFIHKLKQYDKMNAEIPVIHQDVYNFTKKFGFRDEGINRKSVRKDEVLHDQYMLGLTREEAELWAG